jgi:Tfp pilus assembly protein PilX
MVRLRHGEQGSLMIAMAVVLVLTGLALAVLARTISALNITRQDQDGAAALAAANAGLSDALFALDQLSPDATPAAQIPSGAPQSGSIGTVGAFQWRAVEVNSDPNTYAVTSTGTVNSRSRTVTEVARRGPLYPFALFANNGIFFNNKSAAAYSTTAPNGIYAETAGSRDAGSPARQAAIASNRAIVLADGTGGGDQQVVLSPAGTCSGCGNPVAAPGPFRTPDPVVPALTQACPGGGNVDGSASPVVINAGVYLCTGDLTLTGDVSVAASPGNPVLIYMVNGADGDGPATALHLGKLAMSETADPTDLVIAKVGPGTVDAVDPAVFTGILAAPGANLTSPTCELTVTGALVLDTFACDGNGPNFTLAYDSRVEQLRSDRWATSGFREIPTPASL